MLEGHKILVTGLTGRIGGAIAEHLAPHNEVWGLARFTRAGSREEAEARGIRTVAADFAREPMTDVPEDFDYVIHAAANVRCQDAEGGMVEHADASARLMLHCRTSRAFLHVSATGIYKQHPDPHHIYGETDDLGGGYGGQYAPTKLAAEGAVRAAAILLELPTVICRQNVHYGGGSDDPDLIDGAIDAFVATGDVFLPPEGPFVIGPIHRDDICAFVEPCLAAASVPATTVNWGGDELVDWQEMFEYIGALIGRPPRFVRSERFAFPNCYPDPTRRQRIAGPCKVDWRQGVRRTVALRHPGIALRNDV